MNMQDNEMDNLFRSKLEGLEMEPSAHVWDNISREIGGAQQRKSIIPMLRIAASVAVLIGAGLYFMPKSKVESAGTKGPRVAVAPIVKHADVVKPDVTPTVQANPAVNVKQVITKAQPVQQIANMVRHTNKVQPATVNTPGVAVKAAEPVKTQVADPQQQALIANNTPVDKVKAVPNPAIPDVKIVDNSIPVVKPEVIAAVPSTKEGDEQPIAKKRKATGLGGFLNKVIAAVDKRDDKIIEFTDTDEGDTITGINLGIIKVKKQK